MKSLKQWLKLGIIIWILILPFNFVISEEKENVISYTQFLNEMEMGKVKEIKIYCQKNIMGKYIDGTTFITYIPYPDKDLIERARKNNIVIWRGKKEIPKKEKPLWIKIASIMFPLIFLIGMLSIIFPWIFRKPLRLFKTQTLHWEKMPEYYFNELIKKLDILIEVLKEKK